MAFHGFLHQVLKEMNDASHWFGFRTHHQSSCTCHRQVLGREDGVYR